MFTLVRRLFWLAVLSGAGYAVYTAWQRHNEPVPDGPAVWPPLDVDRAPLPDVDGVTTGPAPLPDLGRTGGPVDRDAWSTEPNPTTAWVDPVDGQCPIDHPIKGNANSGIYHVPGGRFYDRTVPQRCYASEDDAVADGYRRAKA